MWKEGKKKENKTKTNQYELPADGEAHTCFHFPEQILVETEFRHTHTQKKKWYLRYWLKRLYKHLQSEVQLACCFDIGIATIKLLEQLQEWFSPWKQYISLFPALIKWTWTYG